jgi:tRNA-binding protein
MSSKTINWSDFEKIDLRVGTILKAEAFLEARNPAYKLNIDFGALGVKKSSAQITDLYEVEDLVGRQVVAVVNFPPKQIANMMSECLVLGAIGSQRAVTLLSTERTVENGTKIS